MRFLFIPFFLLLHPVHVGMISIGHDSGSGTMEVFVKLYFDDFLLDYRLFDEDQDLQLYAEKSVFPPEKLLSYISDRLKLVVDGRNLEGKIVNLGIEDNEMEVNLVYPVENGGKSIYLYVAFLTDLYADQSNMTIVRLDDREEGIKFTPEFREKDFSL